MEEIFLKRVLGLISASFYFLAIIIILISALIIKRFFIEERYKTFILELPEYKLPNIKYIIRDVFEKVTEFIKRAGTIIFICSIIIWFLLSFSWKLEYGIDIEKSILATIGKRLSWFFYPVLGIHSWEATVSSIQGLIAKEQVISYMCIISGFEKSNGGISIFTNKAFSFFTEINAYSFMIFNLFSAPCFGAIGAMRRELGSNKKTFIAIAFQTGIAWVLSSLVYSIGMLIKGGI